VGASAAAAESAIAAARSPLLDHLRSQRWIERSFARA